MRLIGLALLGLCIFLGLAVLSKGIEAGLRWQQYNSVIELRKGTLQRLQREPGIGH